MDFTRSARTERYSRGSSDFSVPKIFVCFQIGSYNLFGAQRANGENLIRRDCSGVVRRDNYLIY